MVQFYKERTAIGVQGVHELAVTGDEPVVVDAQVSRVGTAGVGGDGDGFAHDEAHAAFGTGFIEGDVLRAHGAVQIGQGIAHGFHDDTVFHSEGADLAWGTEVWSHKRGAPFPLDFCFHISGKDTVGPVLLLRPLGGIGVRLHQQQRLLAAGRAEGHLAKGLDSRWDAQGL